MFEKEQNREKKFYEALILDLKGTCDKDLQFLNFKFMMSKCATVRFNSLPNV